MRNPAYRHGPAGSHGDAPKRHIAEFFHHRFGVVGLAHAHTATGDDHVGLGCGLFEGGFKQGRVVAHHTHVQYLAAHACQQAVHGVAVAVVDRALPRGFAQTQNFVASGEVGHFQARSHQHLGQAQAGQEPAGRRPQARARSQGRLAGHQVFAAQSAVVTALQQARSNLHAIAIDLRQFLRHHRVQTRRHDGAGHDLHALASVYLPLPSFACQSGADHLQTLCGRQTVAMEGIAVHGRVVMGRHAQGGNHVLGQYPVQRLKQGHSLRAAQGRHHVRQKSQHAVGRQGLRVIARQLFTDFGQCGCRVESGLGHGVRHFPGFAIARRCWR